MRSRNVRYRVSLLLWFGAGICRGIAGVNDFGSVAALAGIVAVSAGLYLGLDSMIAPGSGYLRHLYRVGGLLFVIINLLLGWGFIRELLVMLSIVQ